MRDRTGRPVDTPVGSGVAVTGQDFDGRKIHLSDKLILDRMLSDVLRTAIDAAKNGYYGKGCYGRCRYGTQPGIYGFDFYGAARYN